MSEYVVAQASVLIVPSLEGFQKELKAELKAIQAELRRNALEVNVEAKGVGKMLGEIELAKQAAEENPIKIRVDTVDVMKKLTEIRHKYEDLGRDMKKALVLDLKIAGMSLLPQLAQGLAAANASMVQLVQSALLLPGALSAAAASILTVVTGLSGVGDAFKEYRDAQKNSAQESLKARNAALNVNNAYRDLGRTIKDAQRNLEDLNAQLRDAPLDEADAIIRLQEARAEAADKYQKSGLQQQKDALAVRRAENDLANTRLRNSRLIQDVAQANAKGVAGADAVVDATERLSKAQDEAATQVTKLGDSLSKLSPNAQAFVKTVTGMDSQWMQFKHNIQDRLFAGLDQEVTNLANNTLPLLTKGFGGIADSINGNLKSALAAFQKGDNQGLLESILGNTAEAQGKMSKAIEPFIGGFLKLSEVGATFLPRLVDGLGLVMQRFENFINVADSNGSLDKWINDGIDALTDLGNTFINLGSIFTSISDAFTGSGGKGMLELLQEASKRLADFLKSDEGQKKLIQFFNDARTQLAMWKPLLDQLPELFGNLADAGRRVTEILMPFLTGSAKLLADHPALVSAAIQAYVGWRTVAPMVKAVKNLLDTELIGTLKQIPSNVTTAYKSFGGFKGAVGTLSQSFTNLASQIGIGGPVMMGFTGLVSYFTYQYINKQNEAAQAASAHATALSNIATQLDSVNGKLTASGLADKLKAFSEFQNTNLNGDPTFNLLTEAQKMGLATPDEITKALKGDNTMLATIQQRNRDVIKKAVEQSPYYTNNKTLLEGMNITLDDLVNAVAGDQAANDKLTKANPGFNAVDIIQGKNKLFGSEPGLSQDARVASQLSRAFIEDARNTAAQRNNIDTATRALAGTATIKPGTPFERLGINGVVPMTDGSGGIKISVDVSKADIEKLYPDLAKLISEKNGSVQADAVGSTITFSDPNVASQYATIEKKAAGGLISGPGTGTSDSILTALSNGEYVINARATSRHLPLLDAINSGAAKYAGGGAVGSNMDQFWVDDKGDLHLGSTSNLPSIQQDRSGQRLTGTGRFNPRWYTPGLGAGNFNEGIQIDLSHASADNPWIGGGGRFANGGLVGIPRYSVGGPYPRDPVFDGGDPSKDPGLPAVGNAIGGFWNWLTSPGMFVTGASAPKPDAPYVDANGVLQGQTYLNHDPYGGIQPTDATAGAIYDRGLGAGIAGGSMLGVDPVSTPAKQPDLGSLLGADSSLAGPTYPYADKNAAPAQAPVTPGASTTHGSGGNPGPGNAGPGPGNFGPGPGNMVSNLPAISGLPAIPGYTPVFQAVPYGLKPGTQINYGQAGFPDWVSQLATRFNLTASTYAGHQETSGLNKGIDFSGTPEQMRAFAEYARTAPGIEQVIFQDPRDGAKIGRDPGDRGANQTIEDYYRNDWAGHTDHVHIRTSQSIPLPEQLQAMMGGSPSNMPLAMTPTGVGLPQTTYTNTGGGDGGGLGIGGFKMPTPEEYAKYVSEAFQSNLQNLVQNAGQIAIKFLGSFFGLDLSSLFGTANSVISGIGGGNGDNKNGAKDNLPANADVAWIMENKDKLPPGYADQLAKYVQENPGQAQNALAQVKAALSGVAAGASVQYNPSGGAEQWRPVVRQALAQVASKYGINNLQAWEDDIVGQINLESGGNPNRDNLNDSNGKGGTQQVFGLGQFHPDTWKQHNVTGGDIHDPVAQIYAMIDYLASPKYGVIPNGGVNWKGQGWRNGKGYAAGGKIAGGGSQTSDSILARVSNGEYIVRADAAQKHLGLLNAINSNALPGFAEGMLWPIGAPAPVTPPPPPPVTTPDPAATPVVPDPMGPIQSAEAGVPVGPTPDGAPDPNAPVLAQAGAALGGIGDAAAGIIGGAQAPAGGTPEGDPRSVLPGAPQNLDHNNPAIAKGVEAAAGVIQGAVSMAVQAGAMAANAQAPGAGQGVSSAAGIIQGLVSTGTSAVTGAVNILSSLGVGTLTPGSTKGAYGTPLLPDQAGQQPYTGPSVVNNFNGGVHTSNNEEFYKIQQRRELQNASPYLPQR